jgi:hypothetical protein
MNSQRIRILVTILAVFSALLLSPSASRADVINFTLVQPNLTGSAGDTLIFQGTLTNPTASTVFLNGDNFQAGAPFLPVDDSAFFPNTPLSLAPSGSMGDSVGPVDLFSVMIGAGAIPGNYTGLFKILGGASSSAQDILATQSFLVTVVPPQMAVPEPGTLAMLGTGIAAAMLNFRRRRKIA